MDASISGLRITDIRRLEEKKPLRPPVEEKKPKANVLGSGVIEVDDEAQVDAHLRGRVVAQADGNSEDTQVIIFSRRLEIARTRSLRDSKNVDEVRSLVEEYEVMSETQLLLVEGDIIQFIGSMHTVVQGENQVMEGEFDELDIQCEHDLATHSEIQVATRAAFVAKAIDFNNLGEGLKLLVRARQRLSETDPDEAAEIINQETATKKAYLAAAENFVHLVIEYDELAEALDPETLDNILATIVFAFGLYDSSSTETMTLDDIQAIDDPLSLLGNVFLLSNNSGIDEIMAQILEKIVELKEMVLDQLAKLKEELEQMEKAAQKKKISEKIEKLTVLLRKLRADKLKLDVLLAKINLNTAKVSPATLKKLKKAINLNQEAIHEAEALLAMLTQQLEEIQATEVITAQ